MAQLAIALRPFAPEASRVSVERIVRVIAGRKEISLPPATTSRAAATHAGFEAGTRFVDSVAAAASTQAEPGPAAETFEPEPPSIPSSWQTTGKFGPSGRGRRAWILGAAAAAVAMAVVAGVLALRSPAPASNLAPVPSAPGPSVPVDVPVVAPASAAPVVTLPVAPSSDPVPSATSSAGPARPPRPPTAPSTTRGSGTTPAPKVPGVDDFGGRK